MLAARSKSLLKVTEALEAMAPLSLAGSWDNVGLLVDSVRDSADPFVVLLTNDLTDKVVQEAVAAHASLIVSYHPTPFGGIKKLVREDRSARVVLACVANGISVFSPHTAMDCAVGGVNDWLAAGVLNCPFDADALLAASEDEGTSAGAGAGSGAGAGAGAGAADAVARLSESVRPIKESHVPGAGEGRVVTLSEPTSLAAIIDRVKRHLKLAHLNVALADSVLPSDKATADSVKAASLEHMVSTVAICAGSGRSVLGGVKADVWLTGEMAHHDCIAATSAGTSVIVCNHSNTERGYLPHLAGRLSKRLGDGFDVLVTAVDADPLVTL